MDVGKAAVERQRTEFRLHLALESVNLRMRNVRDARLAGGGVDQAELEIAIVHVETAELGAQVAVQHRRFPPEFVIPNCFGAELRSGGVGAAGFVAARRKGIEQVVLVRGPVERQLAGDAPVLVRVGKIRNLQARRPEHRAVTDRDTAGLGHRVMRIAHAKLDLELVRQMIAALRKRAERGFVVPDIDMRRIDRRSGTLEDVHQNLVVLVIAADDPVQLAGGG